MRNIATGIRISVTILMALMAQWLVGADSYQSHPPLHKLSVASERALPKGAIFYVDALKGNDSNDGSKAKPWKTINASLKKLTAGDTLCLRQGTYFENVYCAVAGTEEKPITIRSYPGEDVIIDGGIPEFQTDPAKAWKPAPNGVKGEYVSTKAYKNIRDFVGLFGDSNVGLQTYWYLMDLQSENELWINDPATMVKPVYCGPGIFYDRKTGLIHVRLAHTKLTLPPDSNGKLVKYQGETDPRKLPLVIAPFKSTPLYIDLAMHVRFQDLLIRGGGYRTVHMRFGVGIEFENCKIFAGNYAVWSKNTGPLKMHNCGVYGMIPPWAFRSENVMYAYSADTYPPFVGDANVAQEIAGSTKKREAKVRRHIARLPTHAILVSEGFNEFDTFAYPLNHDWEISNCEFADSHDGIYLAGKNIKFHHNWIGNVQDDCIYLSSPTPYYTRDVYIYQNLITSAIIAFGTHARGGPGGNIYVFRNIVDLRKPTHFGRPSDKRPQGGFPYGHGFSTHNSDHIIHMENFYFYQNTCLLNVNHSHSTFDAAMNTSFDIDSERWVLNNMYLYNCKREGAYPTSYMSRRFEGKQIKLVFDANLHWDINFNKPPKQDIFKAARAYPEQEYTKKNYPAGWTTNSVVADPKLKKVSFDQKDVLDFRLEKDSPAIEKGVVLPKSWPDPLRPAGEKRPDIGALPYGQDSLKVGIDGRITAGVTVEN